MKRLRTSRDSPRLSGFEPLKDGHLTPFGVVTFRGSNPGVDDDLRRSRICSRRKIIDSPVMSEPKGSRGSTSPRLSERSERRKRTRRDLNQRKTVASLLTVSPLAFEALLSSRLAPLGAATSRGSNTGVDDDVRRSRVCERQQLWTRRDLNPGPLPCQGSDLPLIYEPASTSERNQCPLLNPSKPR